MTDKTPYDPLGLTRNVSSPSVLEDETAQKKAGSSKTSSSLFSQFGGIDDHDYAEIAPMQEEFSEQVEANIVNEDEPVVSSGVSFADMDEPNLDGGVETSENNNILQTESTSLAPSSHVVNQTTTTNNNRNIIADSIVGIAISPFALMSALDSLTRKKVSDWRINGIQKRSEVLKENIQVFSDLVNDLYETPLSEDIKAYQSALQRGDKQESKNKLERLQWMTSNMPELNSKLLDIWNQGKSIQVESMRLIAKCAFARNEEYLNETKSDIQSWEKEHKPILLGLSHDGKLMSDKIAQMAKNVVDRIETLLTKISFAQPSGTTGHSPA